MFSFLSEFTRDVDAPSTIIVMDAEGYEQPRHYRVVPRHVLFFGVFSAMGLTALLLCVIIFTPLKELIPGYGTAEMRRTARLNELRVIALHDSLEAQDRYASQLRNLMLGHADTTYVASGQNWPDALAGAALAGREEMPMLLVRQGSVPDATWSSLQRLEPGRIPVLGGKNAVHEVVLDQLRTLE